MSENTPATNGAATHAAHAERFPLRKTAGHLIRRAHQMAAAIFLQEVDGVLSPHQFAALMSLCQEPGLHQVDLIERIVADRSTVSALVTRLVKKGFVKKRRNGDDERKTALFITEQGVAAVAAALPGSVRAHDRILSLLPEHLREPFFEALQCLVQAGPIDRNNSKQTQTD